MNQVYALMVGIDKYLPPVPALDGCVNDMRAMRDFLKKRTRETGVPLELVVLENAQASRMNIVSKFETHLAQAGEGDTVFFYFSGHGSQEHAHEVFWPIEPDKKNETLVCFDSRNGDGMDLADKEIATLLDVVAKSGAHVLVVMDCCNSGSGTRGLAKVRSVRDVPPKTRSIDSYILPRPDEQARSLMVSETERVIIPKARHVALSAAHSFELAKETWLGGSPRGVFTFSLLEVLEKNIGPITYYDLMRKVQTLVGQRTYEQTPQMYASTQGDLSLEFLNGSTAREFLYYVLSFDRQRGWLIDAGAVHGMMASEAGGEAVILEVFAEDAPESEMKDSDMALGKVTVVDVYPQQSRVELPESLWLHKNTLYRCRIFSMPVKGIRLNIRSSNSEAIALVQAAWTGDPEARFYVGLTGDPQAADYHLVGMEAEGKESYVISRKSDEDDQALVEQVSGFTSQSADQVVDQLVRIAKWERILALENPSSTIFSEAVRIDILPKEGDTPLAPDSNGYRFAYQHSKGKKTFPRIRVRITNTSSRRLYCSLIHLTSLFGVDPSYLDDAGVWLNPGDEAFVARGKAFILSIKDEIYETGREQVTEIFKLIVSTNEFDANRFAQEPLGAPKTRSATRDISTNSRGLINDNDWNATHISLQIVRED